MKRTESRQIAVQDAARYVAGVLIVGKYRLEGQIGEGGMGTVWLANNEVLDAPIALKLIRPEMQGTATVERLLLEARVGAKLRHPNIVRVFDFGTTEDDDSFIVMEVLEGISLGDLLRQRERLDPIDAVQLLLPVIGALCYAHANGVVHRDLKPDNIFLDQVDRHICPKLLDFGIAKVMADDSQPPFKSGGRLIGSPAYMAPEQARGSTFVDHRADIWAMCVVLYEAVAGKPAFPGEGVEILRGVIEDPLEPLQETGAGEGALWRILIGGLEKDPEWRYQSMRELGAALTQWLSDRGEPQELAHQSILCTWAARPWSEQASVARGADAGVPTEIDAVAPWEMPRIEGVAPQPRLGASSPFGPPRKPRRGRGALLRLCLAVAISIGLLLALLVPSKVRADEIALGRELAIERFCDSSESQAHGPRQAGLACAIESMRGPPTLVGTLAGATAALAATVGSIVLFSSDTDAGVHAVRVAVSCAPMRCGASLAARF